MSSPSNFDREAIALFTHQQPIRTRPRTIPLLTNSWPQTKMLQYPQNPIVRIKIHQLANPLLTRPLSQDTAREWLQRLTVPSLSLRR